ncbi:hypothetical protein [Archangium sp.]|uniref:hypothetical protein n=1 Tax=Archangium sp. TaxID=1872627 RepID=UPI00389ABDA7
MCSIWLVARGHRVLVYTEASARADVEASGAEMVPHQRYRELGARMHASFESMPRWLRRSRLLRIPQMLYVGWFFRRDVVESAMDFTEELEPILRRERVHARAGAPRDGRAAAAETGTSGARPASAPGPACRVLPDGW